MLYAVKLLKKAAEAYVGQYHIFIKRPKGPDIVAVYEDNEFRVKGVGTFQGGGVLKTDFKAAITDLKVYQRGEVATVFIFWPAEAGKSITATVNHGSSKLREVELALDANGVGTFRQDDLQLGEYVVTKDWGLRTTFTVAEYTQSPLIGELSNIELVNNLVRGVLTLSTFGTKLTEGTTVMVELKSECAYYYFQQENLPQTKEFVVGEDGKVKIEFQLPKYFYGGLGLVVTDKQRASLTAEVAIPMVQSAYQMEPSPFSTMGEGALNVSPVANPGSFAQRGLHFMQGSTSSDPIEPVAPIAKDIQLMVHQPCEMLVVGVFNPTTGEAKEHRYQNVTAGSVITLPYEGIFARVAVAAWVKSERTGEVRPFEGVTNFMQPEKVALKIVAPQKVAPGGKLNFSVEATGAQQGSVIVVVKSTALQPNGKPEEKLAEQLLEGFKSTGANAEYVTRKPEDAHYFGYGWCGTGMPESAMFGVARAMAAPMAKGGLESTSAADQSEEPAAREEQQVTTLYAALHSLEDGKVVINLDTQLAMADVTISAFLVTAGDWAAAEPQQVLIVTDLFTKLSPPAHVAPGDMVIMTAMVHSSGKATAHVCADGLQIPFTVNGKLIQPGEAFVTPAVLSFAVRGGELVEVMTENESDSDRVEAFIPILGNYTYDALKLVVVLEGGSLKVNQDGLKKIEVMPGMAGIFAAIAKAVSEKKVLPYDCCGQTAAKLAVMVQAIVDGNKDMRWPLLRGVYHMSTMYVSGKGFRFYSDSKDVAGANNHYAISAALDLRSLKLWIKDPAIVSDPEVLLAVKSLIEMGEDACKAYGLTKGRKISTMQEAFVALKLYGKEREAMNFVSSRLIDLPDGGLTLVKNGWGWIRQSDLAYAAVICLQTGMTREGYQLANAVFGTFDRYCMPYGYLELLPVCLMLSELNKLDAETLVIVNGKEMTTQQLFKFTDPITSLVVVKGAAFVRTTTIVEEDIHSRDVNVHLTAALINPTGEVNRVGDILKFLVSVDEKLWGDVVAIMLPNSLALLKGGAQVRTTEKDLKWWSKMEFDLVAVTDTRKSVEPGVEAGTQTIFVLVRNMDDRTRLGLLPVKVKILPLV
ncbi:hypothetical protein KA078_03155 [Candidatus Woesebacteria bacterium]|nr:hypothetical protein [Candidatus Woesebacteria bacterium]